MKTSTNKLNQAIERMSTGFKVNRASDGAAEYSIINDMNTKINSLQVAEENTAMALDMVSSASGILEELNDRIERLRTLQVQVNNGTYGDASKQAINKECNALVDEIDRLYQSAEYNGITLFMAETILADGTSAVVRESDAQLYTTFKELGITARHFEIYDSSNTFVQAYDLDEADTINDFLSTLQTHGFRTSLNNGEITISSSTGLYVAGDLAIELGINTREQSYVSSTEQMYSVNVETTSANVSSTTVYTTTTNQSTQTNIIWTTTTSSTTQTNTIWTTTTTETTQTNTIWVTETLSTTQSEEIQVADLGIDISGLKNVSEVDYVSGGTFLISSSQDLVALQDLTNSNTTSVSSTGATFILTNDIDMSGIDFKGIGSLAYRNLFTGKIYGNGYKIKNLTINNTTSNYVGLIAYATTGATIKDLTLEDCTVISAASNGSGCFIGSATNTTIENCHVIGNTSINSSNGYVGGFVGDFKGTIIDSHSEATVVSTSNYTSYTGGLVGIANDGSSIDDCYATGDVSGNNRGIGGLIGNAGSITVTDSYATGNIIGVMDTGGFIGSTKNTTIQRCYATGKVVASGNQAGGFVGTTNEYTSISNCYATGDVSSIYYTGGFVGYMYLTTVTSSYSTGTPLSGTYVGGFIGFIDDSVYSSSFNNCVYLSGVSSNETGGGNYGGIAAQSASVITSTYANDSMGFTEANGWTINGGVPILNYTYTAPTLIDATESSSLALIGVSSHSIYLSDGSKINYTFTGSNTFADIVTQINNSGKGLNASFTNGVLNIAGTGISIDTTTGAGNLFALFNSTFSSTTTTTSSTMTQTLTVTTTTSTTATQTVYTTTTSSTTQTTTLYVTTTSSSTQTSTVWITSTVAATGGTTFEELGVSSAFKVTIVSDGTKSTLTVNKDTTFDEFFAQLQSKGFAVSETASEVSFIGTGDTYLNSTYLKNLLSMGALSKTEATNTVNTDSEHLSYDEIVEGVYAPGTINLQVGTSASPDSSIQVDVSFKLADLRSVRGLGIDGNDYLEKIDKILEQISERQLHFGAVQNRLESVIDEIEIKYDNLVASRSTLRDADIATVSAQYIQQQILQQASATLLATANQTPSIALQLI